MIVVLEGIDNCGKNTIAKMLSNKYDNIHQIEFPNYATDFGKFIHKELVSGNLPPISLQLLFSSERLSKVGAIRSLSDKGVVLAVRYSYSAIAYGSARGIDKQLLYLLEKELPLPDIKIFLRISPFDSIQRSKNPDSFESDYTLLSNVAEIYEEIIKSECNWHVIDATKDIEEVFREVEEIIICKFKESTII